MLKMRKAVVGWKIG